MTKKALVLGGGFAGCAAVHQLSLLGGWDVTLIEAGPHLGGGCKTHYMGGHPYTFGPRHFLTSNERAVAYLNDIVPLRPCPEHEFLTYVEADAAFYNYPIHSDDLPTMPEWDRIQAELYAASIPPAEPKNFEEYWVGSIGRTLYDKFVNQYSKKMWMVADNREIDSFKWSPKGVTIKSGPRAAWDSAYSGYPMARNGYDDYFAAATRDVKVRLSTKAVNYNITPQCLRVALGGEWLDFDLIVNSLSPDVIGQGEFGQLPFIGRDLTRVMLPVENALPPNVYFAYYAGKEPYTRVTEYKKFTKHRDQSSTLISLEYPSHSNRLYPLPTSAARAQARRYFDSFPPAVVNVGRAGTYDYAVDVDDCIIQAFALAERVKQGL